MEAEVGGALVALGVQARFQRREFFMNERFQRFQVAARGLAQIRRFFLQGFFQARETLLVVAHVGPEEDVADLIDVAGAWIVAPPASCCTGRIRIILRCHRSRRLRS